VLRPAPRRTGRTKKEKRRTTTAAGKLLALAKATSDNQVTVPAALIKDALPRVGLFDKPSHTKFEDDASVAGHAWIAFLEAWQNCWRSTPVSTHDLLTLPEGGAIAGTGVGGRHVLGRLLAVRAGMTWAGRRVTRAKNGYDYKTKHGYRYHPPKWALVDLNADNSED
jgi:hypothetical protein